MNKTLKIFGVLSILVCPAFAEEATVADMVTAFVEKNAESPRGIGERTDCGAVAAEITKLNNTEDPDQEMLDRLAELQVIQRRDCAKNSGRRRAMGRGGKMAAIISAASTPVVTTDTVVDTTQDTVVAPATDTIASDTVATDVVAETTVETVVAEPVTCAEIGNQIDILRTTEPVDEARIAELQARYDTECIDEISADAESVADLIASGLCADGTTPDSDGCCTGETLTDMGDGMFGCCPAEEGADCFPPIVTGDE